jgi:hypothetical protein
MVSVYEHFGWRTASRNELNSWTEVPLYSDIRGKNKPISLLSVRNLNYVNEKAGCAEMHTTFVEVCRLICFGHFSMLIANYNRSRTVYTAAECNNESDRNVSLISEGAEVTSP